MRCVIEFQRVNGVSVQNSGHRSPKVHINVESPTHPNAAMFAQELLFTCTAVSTSRLLENCIFLHHFSPRPSNACSCLHALSVFQFEKVQVWYFLYYVHFIWTPSWNHMFLYNGGSISKHPTMMLHKRVRVECNFQLEYSVDAFPRKS